MNLHPKISHLNEHQVNELIDRYYQGEVIKDLIAEYNIDVQPGRLAKIFPNLINHDLLCPYCENINMETTRLSRTASSYETAKTFCPECGHYANKDYCSCQSCKEIKRSEAATADEKKKKAMSTNEKICEVEFYDLTFQEVLVLLSLVRHSLSDDLETISPFTSSPIPFTPYYEFTNELIRSLYHRGIVCISSDSDPASCVFDEDITSVTAYYPNRVIWRFLPGMDVEDKKSFIQNLEEMIRDKEQVDYWNEEIAETWRLINKYEAIEYFLYLLNQRGFNPKQIGEKTHAVFDNVLNDFSIAQIFNLTWQAVRDTTDFILANKIGKAHATNMFIGSVQRKADKAKAENWQTKCSRRDFNCRQSASSSTFFDGIVGIGERAMETKPPKIEEQINQNI